MFSKETVAAYRKLCDALTEFTSLVCEEDSGSPLMGDCAELDDILDDVARKVLK